MYMVKNQYTSNPSQDALQYDHTQIEAKWQKIWEAKGLHKTDLIGAKNPYYNLMMYPYPSAEGLHVGHVFAFSGSDVHGRFKRMQGFTVFEPMGFDSGGIHSENFAIKKKVHPKELIASNIKNFTRQLKRLGNMFDWDHTVDAMDPSYYRWTQWLFIQLFKAGLAYKKEAPVTWCPSCKTTVSDEQTEKQGEVVVCERCKTQVQRRHMKQWFFKITDYADRLLQHTYDLKWSEKVLTAQRNWIGKSEGATIQFPIQNSQAHISVFTTRPDTLFGCTFFVLAPEHPLVIGITTNEQKDLVNTYIKKTLAKTEQERKMAEKDKTGVFTGAYVINPVNQEKVPVWIADYVLMGYGEGAVMGVPAHDKRDFDFAKKYDLPIKPVVNAVDNQETQDCYEGEGNLVNSGDWNGWQYPQDLKKVIGWLEEKQIGQAQTTFKIRDWNISRQRYWGPPIPMIYCSQCAKEGKSWFSANNKPVSSWDAAGWYPVPDDQLPVELPYITDYLPDGSGKAPLARHASFVNTTCPGCGSPAQRETDVSDTFLDSSWYFLRYPSTMGGVIDQTRASGHAFDPEITAKWLPVSQYCGGAEHSVLHLLYARFVTMALHDMGHLNFEEPFPNFYAHGMIIKDGAKMSKSRGNVVDPDIYLDRYGADVMRLYMGFMGPYSDGGDFRDTGIAGMERFVKRFWKIILSLHKVKVSDQVLVKQIRSKTHWAIKRVTEGIEQFKYNTSIAAVMELVNLLESIKSDQTSKNSDNDSNTLKQALATIVVLMAPFAPHITEELWQRLTNPNNKKEFQSVHDQIWPRYDERELIEETRPIVVQVNGKLRGTISISPEQARDEALIISLAQKEESVQRYLEHQKIIKTIYVSGKLLNFVVKN